MLLKITLFFSCMEMVYSLQCPTEGWIDVTGKNLESGAWLAEIPNDVTQALLQGYMDNLPNQDWWIGANDLWTVTKLFYPKKVLF